MRRTLCSSKKSFLLVAITILGIVGIDKSLGQESNSTKSNPVQENQSGLLNQSNVDPAELVRGIIAEEAAFYELSSFFIRTKSKWTNTPAGIAERTGELVAQFGESVREHLDQFADDLRPHQTEINESAFDDHRLRSLSDKQSQSHDLRVWNGKRSVVHTHYFANKQEGVGLGTSPTEDIGKWFLLDFGYLRTGGHTPWWNPGDPKLRQMERGLPRDFKLIGQQMFRGHRCWMLENWEIRKRLYVSIADRRLRGFDTLYIPSRTKIDHAPVIRKLCSKRESDTNFDPMKWLEALPADERIKTNRILRKAAFENHAILLLRNYLEDYQEIAPGVWWPMKHGYMFYSEDSPQVITTMRNQETLDIKVNKKLDDKLFEFGEIKEGMQIYDSSFNPPMVYKYKKDRPQAEWDALVENHKQQTAVREKWQAKMDARIGRPAFEFAESNWLNSDPRNWKSLSGNIVILEFWATWCGPCHNDFQYLKKTHGNEDSGIKVISVHSPGTPLEEIQAMVKEHKLDYPVYVDLAADENHPNWGEMSGWYSIRGIPHSVVIDKDGMVAGHGTLGEAYAIVQKLKLASKHRSGKTSDE